METKNTPFSDFHSNPLLATQEQISYLSEGTYSFPCEKGNFFVRKLEAVALNPISGKILVREKITCGSHDYEKMLVLSKDGRPEKLKDDFP